MIQTPQTPGTVQPRAKAGWRAFLQPDPPAAVMLTDKAEIQAQYRYWQKRILISSLIGYALFYFVRKNLSIAMPFLQKDLGITKTDLGLFLTLHGVLYGLSKFANGFLADRANARTMMCVGLILSALANLFFGFGSAVLVLGIIWTLNGWFQGIGFPPCARLMTHWFSPKELATKMSIWNTSHSIGAGLVVVLCGYLVDTSWRLCFIVPGVIAILGTVFLWFSLRDTPQSLGLPEVEGTQQTTSDADGFNQIVWKKVFGNPYIWLIALANFFVYTIRYAVFDWGPTLLTETKGVQIKGAGWMMAAFEISGVAGMLLSGWLTDRLFRGRGARLCVFSMLLAGVSIYAMWKLPPHSVGLTTVALSAAGFFIYGPQALVGITVANLATKRAAATAVGLTGIFGYASSLLSGWGLGKLAQTYGWDAGFVGMLGIAAVGAFLFLLAWPAKPHGYEITSQ